MSKKTLYILGILLTILIGSLLFWLYCCKCSCREKGVQPVKEISNNFVLQGNGLNYHCADNFKFPLNGFDLVQPVGDSINLGIRLIKVQNDSNPLQKLVLTGYCMPSETNSSSFPNLGFARANALKDYLVSQGVPATCIEITGEIKDGLVMKDQYIFGPASYQLVTAEMKPGPLVLNFNTGQSQTKLAPEQNQILIDMVKYLEKVPEAKLDISGFTDNIGNKETNMRLGQARAAFAKKLFMKNGTAENKIECTTKGPDDPVADNSTNDGKAKNRRTVITIK